MKDIQFENGDTRFNCRATGVCIKGNKILLSRLKEDSNWTFVGGKVAFGESTEDAILREFREETGAQLQIDKLIAVIENFFDLQGCAWHQYIFFYRLRDGNGELELFEGERQIADNKEGIYRWFDLSELDDVPVKPDCAKELLKKLPQEVRHCINREA